jgi:hypothetical protein
METLFLVLLAGGIASIGALALRRHRRRKASQRDEQERLLLSEPLPVRQTSDPAETRELDDLRPEDVLLYDGLDLIVSGIARLTADSFSWLECQIDEGERWMIIRSCDVDAVILGKVAADLGLGVEPSESLEYEGKIYQLERKGQASVVTSGSLSSVWPHGGVSCWDYGRPGSDRIWLRRCQGVEIGFVGQRIKRHLIFVLPAS